MSCGEKILNIESNQKDIANEMSTNVNTNMLLLYTGETIVPALLSKSNLHLRVRHSG